MTNALYFFQYQTSRVIKRLPLTLAGYPRKHALWLMRYQQWLAGLVPAMVNVVPNHKGSWQSCRDEKIALL